MINQVLTPRPRAMDSKPAKRSLSGKGVFTRADTLDIKSLDTQLEKRLSKVLIRDLGSSFSRKNKERREEWEIEIPKLEIRYVIAKGTYGTVFRGNYDANDVAVKLLDWGPEGIVTDALTADRRSSFYQEVKIWHKLNHPNITQFVGATMVPADLRIPSKVKSGIEAIPARACCVVLEYLGGGTLKQYLIKNRTKGISFEVFIQFALDMAKGLEYLHSKKIVHRDVKSENMLLDTKRNLKIADFGVARVEALNPRDMTGETGTVSYMAPEVLEGKPYNHKCDVYSYGICLWEMYCCKMPYAGFHFHELSTKVVRQNMRPEIPRRCPTKLAKLMKKCWDANPANRPEMSEIVAKLEEINNGNGERSCFFKFCAI